MNTNSKITLSDEEQQLVNNAGWILTKRAIIDKVVVLLGQVSEAQQSMLNAEKEWLPAEVSGSSPKISKGENYQGLPYVMLDYPRCFGNENMFAVRTMFWWGNFFSITLLLSGEYKRRYQQLISSRLKKASSGIYIGINKSPWQHHFENDNYVLVEALKTGELELLSVKQDFLKLATRFPLHQWDDVSGLLHKSFEEMIGLMKD